ncbi:MAG: hypothetical protein WC087_01765 [Candidatus Paceibacterota bacterium]
MANQITHIVLAEKMSDELFKKFDKESFLVGTVFPDIRYLKIIDREKTHLKGLSIKDVLDEENSFIAGLKYHSLVDEAREKYMVEKGIYSIVPDSKFITQAIKIYEDEILYSKVSDWNEVAKFLDKVLPEETQLVAQGEGVKMWHFLLQEYFKDSPTDISRKNFILGLGYSEEVALEVNELIGEIRNIPEIREIILELWENWDLLLK